jgi:hypothetical protein
MVIFMTDTKSKTKEDNFVPQMKVNPERRKGNQDGNYYTDAHWHPSKSISLSNIIGFLAIFVAGYIAYSDTSSRLEAVVTDTTKDVAVLSNIVAEANKDKIHASTVLEMFRTRDVQIKNLADKMSAMELQQGETNRLLTSIYREMPKRTTKN